MNHVRAQDGAADQSPLQRHTLMKAIAWAVVCALVLPAAPVAAQAPARGGKPPANTAKPAEETVMPNFVGADLQAVVRAIG